MIPLILISLALAAVGRVQSQDVIISGTEVTLICGETNIATVKWNSKESTNNFSVDTSSGRVKEKTFNCEYTEENKVVKRLFYVDVQVCENCYDLTGLTAAGVIIGDLLVTAGVILIVYMCVPKHTQSAQQRASNPRSNSNAPRPPNPDYEPLDRATLSSGLYSGIRS